MPKRKRIELPPVQTLAIDENGAESRREIQTRLGISERRVYDIIQHYAALGKLRTAKIPSKNVGGDACLKLVYWIVDG